MFDSEIAETDAFLAADKSLDGFLPPWRQLYASDWQVRWGILDDLGIQRAELCLSVDAKLERPSIVAIFKKRLFYRLDLVPMTECKPNPPDAWQFGLPPRVCGSHTHPWPENREHVRIAGFRHLVYRKPVPTAATTLERALAITLEDLNLSATPSQRDVHLPSQATLVMGGKR